MEAFASLTLPESATASVLNLHCVECENVGR